jgi:hypothetical protein
VDRKSFQKITLQIRTHLLQIRRHHYSLLNFKCINFFRIQVIWRTHIHLEFINKYGEIHIVICFIDQVPAAKVEILIHWFCFFFLWVVFFVMGANVFRIEFGRDFSHVYVGTENWLIHIGWVYLYDYFNQSRVKLLSLFAFVGSTELLL